MAAELKIDPMRTGLISCCLVPYYLKDTGEDSIKMKNFLKRTKFLQKVSHSLMGIESKHELPNSIIELTFISTDEMDSFTKEFIKIYNGNTIPARQVIHQPNAVFYLFVAYYDPFGDFMNVVKVYPYITPYLYASGIENDLLNKSILVFRVHHDSYNLLEIKNPKLEEQISTITEMLESHKLPEELEDHFNEIVKSLPN